MFVYRPPKGNCWGHVIRSNDPLIVKQKLDAFFDTYFERVEHNQPTAHVMAWKSSVLPNTDWPEELMKPENQRWQRLLFSVTGNRIMFPLGIVFPLSPEEPASYEFLGRFSGDVPFKMSPKHFQVGIVGKTGKFAWRKPDAVVAERLRAVIV